MSIHNICFHGEIRNISIFLNEKHLTYSYDQVACKSIEDVAKCTDWFFSVFTCTPFFYHRLCSNFLLLCPVL